MFDPRILLVILAIGAGAYATDKAVAVVKKVDRAVAHGAKVAGAKIGGVLKKVAGQ